MLQSLSRLFRVALVIAVPAVLSGCAGLATLQSVTEAGDLYDLTPKSRFAEDLPAIDWQMVIEEPTAASSVNTDRIAVKPNAFQVQYFPGSRWVDRAPRLVQTMLVESFENTGKVKSVGRQAIGLTADFTLMTDLREFQAEEKAGPEAPVSVHVRLNMKIVKEPEGLIFASRSFERDLPSKSNAMLDVVETFDEALGKTMRESVEWAVREISAVDPRYMPRR